MMILTIKLNNIFKFLIRRAKLIILSCLVFTIGFYLINNQVAKNKIDSEKEISTEVNKDYVSEFSLLIEKPEKPDPIISISTIKAFLTDDNAQEKLNDFGINVDDKDLSDKLILFIRNSKGEKIYFRIVTSEEELTRNLANAYFDLITNQKIDYFKEKNIFVSTKPTTPTQDIPAYSDLHSSTDMSLMNANKPTEKTQMSSLKIVVYGIGLGLIFGIILSLFVDIMDKKIHSVSYIKTSLEGEPNIYDATIVDQKTALNRLAIYLANFSNRALVVFPEKTGFIENWVDSLENEKVLLTDDIGKNQIAFSDKALVFVLKNETTIMWLQNQIDILETTGKDFLIIFVDK